jgi:hypothetical protein
MADEEENAYLKPGSIRRPGGSSSAVGFYTRGVQPTETPVSDYTDSPISDYVPQTSGGDGGGNGTDDPFADKEASPYAGNTRYIDVNPAVSALMRAGSLVPGVGGLAVGAVNAGIGFNNLDWTKNQRRALGMEDLNPLQQAGAVLGFNDYGRGKVGTTNIGGNQYEVTKGGGLVGDGSEIEKRTSLTPAEALARVASNKAYGTPGGGSDRNGVDRGPDGNYGFGESTVGAGRGSSPGRTGLSSGGDGNSGNNSGFGNVDTGPDGNYGFGESTVGAGRGSSPGRTADTSEGDSGSDSGSSRVICTELRRQGLMSYEDWRRDMRYTSQALSPRHVRGYHYWAIPVVKKMRRSRLWSRCWHYIGQHRANQIAFICGDRNRPDAIGAVFKFLLEAFCWVVGGFVKDRNYQAELYDGKEPF